MQLDRDTARALVDANMMSLKEYIERFASADEEDAGKTNGTCCRASFYRAT